MNHPEPTIRINVDPTNPGQFFACCGLLELASRKWPTAEACFSSEGREFFIYHSGSLAELLEMLGRSDLHSSLSDEELKRLGSLLSAEKSTLSEEGAAEKFRLKELWGRERLHLGPPFDLWIDWWADEATGGDAMKTWAAKQFVVDIARPLHRAILTEEWWRDTTDGILLRTSRVNGIPFYFDAHSNWQSTPRDVGLGLYSLRNVLETRPETRPLLEYAAFLGIQRFRPESISDKRLSYCLWKLPLPATVASVAATGRLYLRNQRLYAFRMLFRSKYMKAFLPAEPYQGE